MSVGSVGGSLVSAARWRAEAAPRVGGSGAHGVAAQVDREPAMTLACGSGGPGDHEHAEEGTA
ncbi:hypothetical protein [Nocardia pneumoniae]|uniref:hypothetical protein n=1 Tax=Nocardia pneumoniae TaxID=228601 RepID=UPI0002E6BD54|nr:hypothetical protein [Nocardia pneumoniae]